MAARIANQIQLMFTLDGPTSYESIESALVGAGFDNYDIARQVYADTTDVTVTLMPEVDAESGQVTPFDAHAALQALADAAEQFSAEAPA